MKIDNRTIKVNSNPQEELKALVQLIAKLVRKNN